MLNIPLSLCGARSLSGRSEIAWKRNRKMNARPDLCLLSVSLSLSQVQICEDCTLETDDESTTEEMRSED